MNKHVTVAEIGPRDGFQSISCMMIPTETKLEIIEAILASGAKNSSVPALSAPRPSPRCRMPRRSPKLYWRNTRR